jgi:hypothetical protein
VAGYSLIASESTVQVLSPTLVNDIVYCTIQTSPTGVIASMPVQADVFNAGQMGPELTAFADGIETIVGRGNVIGGSGAQTIDASGLLQDQVSFTVAYVPPGTTVTSITAEALVPVGYLNQSDPAIAQAALNNAVAIVTTVYDNLKAAAGTAAPAAAPAPQPPSGGGSVSGLLGG